MCKCGCNTCETKSTLMLNESLAPRAILSEGLKYHIDNNKPLTEHLYRAGSSAYFNLIAEARSLYSRGILEFTNEDDLAILTETDLGHFGMFEGKKVPLDFPIELNEQMDIYDDIANSEFGMDYDQLGSNEKEWVRDEIDNMEMRESLNESNSNYPDFDLDKNIRYQDTVITNGMWRYTGKESGGAGVYRNLNNDQFLSFDRSDFDIFRNHLSSHFDFSESLNEAKMPTQDQVDKFFALTQNEMHYLNSKPVMGQEKTFNKMEVEPWDEYDLSNFNALVRKAKSKGKINENKAIITFKNDYEVKMNHIAGYDDDFEHFEAGERESVYILDKNAPFQRVHVEFGDGTNAFIPKDVISVKEKSLEEAYSGFRRGEPEDPDSEPFNPRGAVAEFKEDLRALFGKFKGDLKNPEFIKGVGEIMVSWKSLLRSQLGEATVDYDFSKEELIRVIKQLKRGASTEIGMIKAFEAALGRELTDDEIRGFKIDPSKVGRASLEERINTILEAKKKKSKKNNKKLNKPMRDSSGGKAYKVYVKDPKTKKIKTVRFGSGGLRAKINDKKARNAFAKRHKCSTKKDKTKAGYWSCRLPRYAKLLGLKSNFGGFW